MSVTTAVPSRLKASEGRRIAPTKSAFAARYSRMAAFCLSSVKCAGDQGQDAAGLQGVDGLGEEVIVQRQLLAAIVELEVGERHVADHGVDAVLGQLRVAEVLDADVVVGVQRSGDAAGDGIQLDADEAHALRRPWLMKLPVPQPGSRTVALRGHAEAGNGLVHGAR